MSETITASLTVSGGDVITAQINTLARGPAGPAGEGGSGAITSATTSDGTANLSLLNVATATATVSGTLTAPHIHGNLAGSVYAHVRAGEALLKGQPVYVSGFNNGTSTAEVSKADASNAAKMPAIGIMDADLAHNATGHMVITGTITDVNTAGYAVNSELYVAAGGGMTATPPTALAQPVARVERVNANNGAIIVKVNGLSASDATANTLVRRTSDGSASFTDAIVGGLLDVGDFTADGSTGDVIFGSGSQILFQGISYTYGAGADAAHRTALGSGATGDELFTALSPAAARGTLEMVPKSQVGTPTLAASWTDNGGGSYTNTAGATGDTLVLPWSGLTDGKTYLLRFTVTAFSGGGNIAAYLGAVNSSDLFSGAFSAARAYVFLWVKRSGTANQITFRVNSTITGSMTINDIRVVELPF